MGMGMDKGFLVFMVVVLGIFNFGGSSIIWLLSFKAFETGVV